MPPPHARFLFSPTGTFQGTLQDQHGKMALNMLSVRVKLLFYFLAVTLLPLITLGLIGPSMTARSVEAKTIEHTRQIMRQVNWNMEFLVQAMEDLAFYLSRDPDVRSFLVNNAKADSPAVRSSVLERLAVYGEAHPEIAGMLILSADDRDISRELQRINRDPLTRESWYQAAVFSPRTIQLFPRPVGRNLHNSHGTSDDEVVSVVKAVSVTGTDGVTKVRGVVLIDLRLSIFAKMFDRATLGTTGFLFIADMSGGFVYTPVNPVVYRINPLWLSTQPDDLQSRSIRGSNYQIMAFESEYTHWKTVGVFSMADILSEVNLVRTSALIISGITLFFAALVSVFFTSSIALPLIRLRELMKRAEAGDFSVRYEGRAHDEVGQLGDSFNNMIGEIRNLVGMVYHEQQSKREAEVRILHEQIKPHFLYNTLDTIQWMAQEHGAENVVKMVTALTRLFRIGLSRGRDLIRVSEEFEHVRNYLIIQKARYGDKFEYSLDYHPDVADLEVLRVTLQPLVENAIYHGIKERRGNGTISVRAYVRMGMVGGLKPYETEILVMQVKDDGAGISAERLTEVRAMLNNEKPPIGGSGYALYNVHERLRLSFGEGYGCQIESQAGLGTTVTVLHPRLI